MLISKRHKFIFVHIPKNAGTSFTKSLLPYTEDRWKLVLNKILAKVHLPKIRAWDPKRFVAHLTAQEMIDLFGEEQYKLCFSFAVVRNPWDSQVSLYSYVLKTPHHYQHEIIKGLGTFDNYIRWRCNNYVRFQKDYIYSSQGELLVDYVARFETLAHDFAKICARIGVDASLPMLNVSNTKPYQSFYTDETRRMVAEAYAPDIELFGYSFATDSGA